MGFGRGRGGGKVVMNERFRNQLITQFYFRQISSFRDFTSVLIDHRLHDLYQINKFGSPMKSLIFISN